MGSLIISTDTSRMSPHTIILSTFLFSQLLTLVYSDGGWCDRTGQDKWFDDRIFPLMDAVNDYRRQNGRPAIKCDEILTETAYRHTVNQIAKPPGSSSKCSSNGHSWLSSDKQGFSRLKTCCYDNDANCMLNKPHELYEWYTGFGFEITCRVSKDSPLSEVLDCWKDSKGQIGTIVGENDIILGKNGWDLKRIGCFRNGDWANCWFSEGWDANDI